MPYGIYIRSKKELKRIRNLRKGLKPWNQGLTKKSSLILLKSGIKIAEKKKNRIEPIRTKSWKDNISKALQGKEKPWMRKSWNAKDNGVIRIYGKAHILAMEKKLGRKLLRGEIVHHLDGDRTNNNIKNLYLFKNNSDHIRYEHRILRNAKLFLSNKISKAEFVSRIKLTKLAN